MHLLILTILLTGPDPVDATTEHVLEVDRDPDELYDAPTISPIPDGLPEAQVMPRDGRWESTTKQWPAGLFLPPDLNLELRRYRRACDRLPDAMQVQLNQLKIVHTAEIAQAVALAVARVKVDHIRQQLDAPPVQDDSLPAWLYFAGGAVLVVLGGAAGWLLHGLVTR